VLSYANVVATLALFLVLSGGAAYAVARLGKGSVGTRQLRNGAVSTAKLRNGAVTGAKIRDGAIGGAKVDVQSLGTVPSARQAGRADSAGRAESAGRADTAGRADSAAIADSAKTATSATTAVEATSLGGVGPQAFSRQASSATAGIALQGGNGTAREVTLNAPRDGYLLAIASANVSGLQFNTEVFDRYSCFIIFEGSAVPQTERRGELLESAQISEECETNAVIPVAAGAHNVRFAFSGLKASTQVDHAELDVVFVPFAM
jgi:hypothetical protein